MTRKDYIRIAGAIANVEAMNEEIPDERGLQAATLRIVVDSLCGALREDNPRFNRATFEMAALPIQHARRAAYVREALEATHSGSTA